MDIKSGKIMDIVLEITDGGSSDRDAAKTAVDELIEKKVIVRAFQIGKVNSNEREAFESVWNRGRERGRGERVGVNISALIPAITKALKEYLGDVSI
jgi:ribosomal protein L19E